jgi:pilus assembly protein CpaF
MDRLVELGSLPGWYATLLRWAVRLRQDIAVAGGTGSGKTTLLNALSCEIDHGERVITIEDSAELRFDPRAHVVRLEARDASIEGTGEVTIRDLVKNALRMRPDRIVVGEVRGAEAIDMLQAMNTGHDGSLTTLHAGTAQEAILRLVLMARFGMDLPASIIEEQVSTALDLLVLSTRRSDGSRRITGLSQVARSPQGGVELHDLVSYDQVADSWHLEAEPAFVGIAVAEGQIGEEEVRRWRSEVS